MKTIEKNSDKKNLVIVRAGDRSLHEGWLEGQRNWDIIVSGYGNNPEKWQRDDVMHIICPGGKFDGLYDAFQQIPSLLDKYDYIMMADDDFKMTAHDINRFFDIMREHDLQVAQPSLSYQSHALYHTEFHNPQFKIRFSNFAEAITVCLSAKVWRQILPLYQDNPMAYFIDNFWWRLTDDPARQTAFIDEVQVTHTRSFGGELHANRKTNRWKEEGPVQYTVPDHVSDCDAWMLPKVICHAGILENGRHIRGRWAMIPFLLAGWIKAAKHINRTQISENRSLHRSIRRSLKNQITGIFKPAKTSVIVHGTDQQKPRKPHKVFEGSRNLVIVRAGDRSLHEGWLEGQRNWDIITSYYGENPKKWQRHHAQRHDIKHIIYHGGKGDGLYDVFQQMPNLLEQYDYIMMADDDFKMTAHDINRTFDIMREHNLQIGQPSFSYQSHVLYFPQVHNPRFKIRFTNFVEASTVCLSANVWRQILPLYENNPIGWFIDYFWARLTDDPARQVAFIDDIQITHTQPYGSGILYKKKKEYGWKEKGPVKYIVPDHDLKLGKWRQPKIVCHAGILKNGRHVRGRWAMLPFLASGWLHTAKNIHRSQIVANRAIHRCFKQAVKNQITGTYKPTKTHIIIPDHDQKHQKPKKDKKNLVPKNLVIVRAGDHSLHESWLDGQRNWDIVVSGFGSDPDQWKRHDAQHDDPTSIFYRGGKFDGIYDAFQQIPDLLEKYEYIMMIDDDFKTTAHDLNRLFEIMREHDLQIGYPSLSYQSHGLYFPAYHNPRFKIRFSNFVENNAVCLHQSIWRQILPLYQDNPMGHRIDDFWARLSDEPARQVAFIDDIQITHTRPHGSGELHQNKEKYNWRWEGPVQYTVPDYQRDVGKWDLVKIVCHAGILKDGSFVSGRDEMLPHLTAGWREAAKHIKRSQMRRKRSVRRCIKFSIKNQRTGTSNLAKTHIAMTPQKTAAAPDPAQPPQEP